MSRREPAWRVLAAEFNQSTEDEKGAGERAASFVISPFGARMNRVLLAGTLAAPEPAGRANDSPSLWRSSITDPTGSVTVTAGTFQPRALSALRSIPPGDHVLLVGKAHLFRSAQGIPFPSVRAESLRTITEKQYRTVLAEAVAHVKRRIALRLRLAANPAPSERDLQREGFPLLWVAASRHSAKFYPAVDSARFEKLLPSVLTDVSGATSPAPQGPTGGGVRITTRAPPPPKIPADPKRVNVFLELVDALSGEAPDGYADLRDALRLAQGKGLSTEHVEEILNRLEEDGVLEEPIVGKLRRA